MTLSLPSALRTQHAASSFSRPSISFFIHYASFSTLHSSFFVARWIEPPAKTTAIIGPRPRYDRDRPSRGERARVSPHPGAVTVSRTLIDDHRGDRRSRLRTAVRSVGRNRRGVHSARSLGGGQPVGGARGERHPAIIRQGSPLAHSGQQEALFEPGGARGVGAGRLGDAENVRAAAGDVSSTAGPAGPAEHRRSGILRVV